MNQDKLSSYLERFFWFFIFLNPFLDIINGVFLNMVMEVGVLDVEKAAPSVTPSLIIRMLVLLVFAFYILRVKDNKAIISLLPIGIVWVLSVSTELLYFSKINLFTDAQYIARFVYNLTLLFVYSRVFGNMWENRDALKNRLDTLIAFTIIILASSILLSYLFDVGYSTYGDRMGYRGNRGFFYAGNDITAILMLLMPVSMANFMHANRRSSNIGRNILLLIPGGFAANALMIIGSKTAFIAVAFTFGILFLFSIYSLIFKKDKGHELLGFFICLLAAVSLFFILMLFSSMDLFPSILASIFAPIEIAKNEGIDNVVFSGRQFKMTEHFKQFSSGGIFVWLFGMGRGSQPIILEMDVFEVMFYYGIAGIITMLWIYIKAGIDFLKCLIKQADVISFSIFFSLGLCIVYLVMAGHILFSVTSGFYFIFVINYSRVYFAKSRDCVLI